MWIVIFVENTLRVWINYSNQPLGRKKDVRTVTRGTKKPIGHNISQWHEIPNQVFHRVILIERSRREKTFMAIFRP